MKRAVFVDRDNTIILNDGYIGDPAGVVLLPHVAAGLMQLKKEGFMLISVSNQAGVAHGMFTEEDVDRVNAEMCRQLEHASGVTIDKCYSCYFHDKPKTQDPELLKKYWIPNHPDRKPNPGMLKKAAAEFGLDLDQCWMIGDSLKDVEAGQAVGCRTILLSDPSTTASPDSKKGSENTRPDFETDSWIKIPAIIQREGIKVPRQGSPSKDTISPFGI